MTITAEKVLFYLAQRRGVRFSTRRGEYTWNANGRTVSTDRLLRELAQLQDHYTVNVERHAERLLDGRLSLPQWQGKMRREIRDLHRTQYIIGRGGRSAMTQRDWGRLGASMRWDHYRALDRFADDIADGRMTGGAITYRSRLYVNSSNNQYWMGRTAAKIDAGYKESRRLLHPAEHCADCVGYAAQGWQPIGVLPDPGEGSACGPNCRCTKIFRKGPKVADPIDALLPSKLPIEGLPPTKQAATTVKIPGTKIPLGKPAKKAGVTELPNLPKPVKSPKLKPDKETRKKTRGIIAAGIAIAAGAKAIIAESDEDDPDPVMKDE